MRKFGWRRALAVTGIAAMVAGFGPVDAANAASGSKEFREINFTPGVWSVGDCRLTGTVYASAGVLRMDMRSLTTHTSHADVWHSLFVFYRGTKEVGHYGSLDTSPLDSPQMVPANGRSEGPSIEYTWQRSADFNVTEFPDRVVWYSAC